MLFIYKIADQKGKVTTGQIDASSNAEASAVFKTGEAHQGTVAFHQQR